ncbi:hypothetical protein CEXT_490751 [Caerostris extrusa]|uniref:Uncharacterized protein n=1 Tax=Caerostris extrusa TaxID=172846 RepID=A0AAV4XPH0_CAEEX|nr:hypothetical protein CEXT_490751 [Caerostris extrusa]
MVILRTLAFTFQPDCFYVREGGSDGLKKEAHPVWRRLGTGTSDVAISSARKKSKIQFSVLLGVVKIGLASTGHASQQQQQEMTPVFLR